MKALIAVLLAGLSFVGGYQYAAALYSEDIADLREEYATRSQAMEEKYREKERAQNKSLVLAWEQRDAAYARLRERGAELERVRGEAESARRRLSSNSDRTCSAEREQLTRSAELLERCGCLLERGVELSSKSAIDKDAIVKMTKAPRS